MPLVPDCVYVRDTSSSATVRVHIFSKETGKIIGNIFGNRLDGELTLRSDFVITYTSLPLSSYTLATHPHLGWTQVPRRDVFNSLLKVMLHVR